MANLNVISKWAARDEEGPYRDLIVIGDVEPTLFMGKWDWKENRNFWSLGPNEGNISIYPGQKKKINIYMLNEEDDVRKK